MINRTIPNLISVVTIDDRLDGIYAFTFEREAERFLDAIEQAGGSGVHTGVPLNLSPEDTDDLIEAERDE